MESILGHIYQCFNFAHFYCATKHAVTALTEGIRQELRELNSHIRVTSISPGGVETEFAYRLFDKDPHNSENLYAGRPCLSSGNISDAVLYVLGAPAHVQVHELIVRPTEEVL